MRTLAPRVAKAVERAEHNGALDMYVYRKALRGVEAIMGFSVSVVHLGSLQESELQRVFPGLSPTSGRFVQIGTTGDLGFRVEAHDVATPDTVRQEVASVLDIDPSGDEGASTEAQDAGIVVKHTRVSYLILIPGSTGSYLFLVFTVADGPLADAQVFHFDAIVSTLTWVSADDS